VRKKPNIIFFPSIATMPTELVRVQDSCACPTVAATPEVVKAAFTKEGDIFAENGVAYHDPVMTMAEPDLLERELLAFSQEVLGATPEENAFAVAQAFAALDSYKKSVRERSTELLRTLEREQRIGIVLLGRPYHNDPGLNHEIVESLQKCGYPIFSIDSLPTDDETLDALFGEEIREGIISSPFDITDVWKNSYSENSSRKIWGAKYVARHPNLVALDLSSFKCGHDAPIYHTVESIVESSGTPYFTFHDIDENRPAGSIKIRVETIGYFLQRYQEDLMRRSGLEERIEEALRAYEERLRRGDPFINPDEMEAPAKKSRWQDAIPLEMVPGLAAAVGGGGGCSSGGCSSGGCGPCGPR
jgi:predicted nucleotide-binding protein (sugar kinase/HSP70/actin superfamily)